MDTNTRPTRRKARYSLVRGVAVPRLRAIRESQRLGLNALAEMASVDQGALSRAERGKARLSQGAVDSLASALGVDSADLTGQPVGVA